MKLKRHFRAVNADPERLVFDHMELIHTGVDARQNFSVDLVAHGLTEGWIRLEGDVLHLHAVPEDLQYKVLRVPGKYASDVIHYYECVLNQVQHEKYCARTLDARREAQYLLHGIKPKLKSHVKEATRG